MSDNAVSDNPGKHRFELKEESHIALANYRRQDDVYVIPHVEAPPELRGKGTAGRLMQGIADRARAERFAIFPTCSYAVAWFRRHPEAADVLAK